MNPHAANPTPFNDLLAEEESGVHIVSDLEKLQRGHSQLVGIHAAFKGLLQKNEPLTAEQMRLIEEAYKTPMMQELLNLRGVNLFKALHLQYERSPQLALPEDSISSVAPTKESDLKMIQERQTDAEKTAVYLSIVNALARQREKVEFLSRQDSAQLIHFIDERGDDIFATVAIFTELRGLYDFVTGYKLDNEVQPFACSEHVTIFPLIDATSGRTALMKVVNSKSIELITPDTIVEEGETKRLNTFYAVQGQKNRQKLIVSNGYMFEGDSFKLISSGGETMFISKDTIHDGVPVMQYGFPDLGSHSFFIANEKIITEDEKGLTIDDLRGSGVSGWKDGCMMTGISGTQGIVAWNKVRHPGIGGMWKAGRGDYASYTGRLSFSALAELLRTKRKN